MLFLFVYILLNKAKLKRQLYYLKICCAPHVNLIFLNYFASHFQFIYHCSWIMCYCMFSLWFSSCLITSTFLQWKRCHSTKRHNNYLKDEMKNEGIKSCLREIRSFSWISQQGSLFYLVVLEQDWNHGNPCCSDLLHAREKELPYNVLQKAREFGDYPALPTYIN